MMTASKSCGPAKSSKNKMTHFFTDTKNIVLGMRHGKVVQHDRSDNISHTTYLFRQRKSVADVKLVAK